MDLVITMQGFDYMVELKSGLAGVYYDPPIKQLFGGVNPYDAYTDGGFTPDTIVEAAEKWAKDQSIFDGKPLKVRVIKE